ncbi:hypothetical protein COY28_03395 [Candidatus Woesearchaeota archaeon CG_4_10_14_0_2_um_filter_57_5]|nr:MAG: hypothetical protein AUJ68_01435 [Candidatus Woesearchaeota archaeon CG1_02_57_44]PIN68459.1 MAG: hypothetical protein COV94_04525 [Candidatus Woesearchaeota archaeon CG11_big_fil_rev_8_21_14_0_20_57_5]PIZ53669.1 MAG: hypothetical protein COY28_03395 [Candidatus Woesearchaeota archaeon CG_4_10_14_0_2_um_filter_57_5]
MPNWYLLVVDEDLYRYDTPVALQGALRQRPDWRMCHETDHRKVLDYSGIDAVLVDNDFGAGRESAQQLLDQGLDVGYVTAYDRNGLALQEQRRHGPWPFDHPNLTLLAKPGKNVNAQRTTTDLEAQMVAFLDSVTGPPESV